MEIKLSSKIDAMHPERCERCKNLPPWRDTIAKIEKSFHEHGVSWPSFVIMHGADQTCAEVQDQRENLGIYVVATDANGKKAKAPDARVFDTSEGNFVGVDRILNGNAFRTK